MADESHFSSATDSGGNKRKYDDQTTPPSRRVTGFSSPGTVPASYSSVPPPADGIELAKQRAQEIAARLYNNASAGIVGVGALDAKRPRFENGGGFDVNDKGFSSVPSDVKSGIPNSVPSSIPVSYGYQSTSKKIEIPNGRVGVIIGKGGETIKYLQLQSGAKIQVTRDMDADPNSLTRMVELMGTSEQIAKAEQLITEVLAEAEAGAGGQSMAPRRVGGQTGSEPYVTKIPNNKVGLVIGKGGETIKNMQARSGARIQVIPLHLPPGDTSTERTLQIDGTSEQIENAKELVNEVISENRLRNSTTAGGYMQQGYQARPPSSWAPPGPPMQQPGYGYGQPGAYPGQSSQYNVPQTYSGYTQQSGGYPSNWDNSTAPPQQTPQGGGYDYYGQQPPPHQQQTPGVSSAPADNAGYNYSQPPASGYQQGQGYSQDGYSGYHAPQSGYGQPPAYDQQQGYSAASYGNVTNPTQEGHASSYNSQGDSTQAPAVPPSMGQQGYGTGGQQPNPIPATYPSQGANQPGYGMPPTSQAGYGGQAPAQPYVTGYGTPQAQKLSTPPPVYGQQTTQSPSTPGGYGQPTSVQPTYSHSQPPPSGYAQTDSSLQRGPPSIHGGPASQPGYAQPYGAPPVSQPGYGQAPPYNASYGAGYSQAPASADGSATGITRGAFDAAPASQSAQPSVVSKASPQS